MTLVDRISQDRAPDGEDTVEGAEAVGRGHRAGRVDSALAYALWQRWRSLMTPDESGLIGYDDLVRRPGWMARAECRGQGTEAFFRPFGAEGGAARAICARCAVRPECLEHALADPELRGVWGGTSERERQRIRRAGPWNSRRCGVPAASR